MFGFLKRLFGKKEPEREFSDEECDRHYHDKQAALEKILGPMHNIVGHAILPFSVGGAVDLYYFCKGIPGTGFATMELIAPDGSGPKRNRIGTYELVSFTSQVMSDRDDEGDENHAFNRIQRRICGTLTGVGRYSYDAVLNPGETAELPVDDEEPNRCLILDEYDPNGVGFTIAGKKHGLLLCMEIFRSEMEYAMEKGSAALYDRLKAKGHYPYSDLDRDPVV